MSFVEGAPVIRAERGVWPHPALVPIAIVVILIAQFFEDAPLTRDPKVRRPRVVVVDAQGVERAVKKTWTYRRACRERDRMEGDLVSLGLERWVERYGVS